MLYSIEKLKASSAKTKTTFPSSLLKQNCIYTPCKLRKCHTETSAKQFLSSKYFALNFQLYRRNRIVFYLSSATQKGFGDGWEDTPESSCFDYRGKGSLVGSIIGFCHTFLHRISWFSIWTKDTFFRFPLGDQNMLQGRPQDCFNRNYFLVHQLLTTSYSHLKIILQRRFLFTHTKDSNLWTEWRH